MEKLVITTEEDLKKIFVTELENFFQEKNHDLSMRKNKEDEELITNLLGISKLLHCSLPTAQKIKNTIPKDLYLQVGKKFAIKKSVLLRSYQTNKH